MEKVEIKADKLELKEILEKHLKYTGSKKAKKVLDNFEEYLPKFKKIIPNDYQKMMVTVGKLEERGMSHEAAKLEAFYLAK